jgi:hypothetical protein
MPMWFLSRGCDCVLDKAWEILPCDGTLPPEGFLFSSLWLFEDIGRVASSIPQRTVKYHV